jgi:hypothetical protein
MGSDIVQQASFTNKLYEKTESLKNGNESNLHFSIGKKESTQSF